jgi:2-keto-3-deoxy-L-rhamnonate aldolase RhmA
MARAAVAAGLPLIAPVFDPDPAEARRQRDRWLDRGASLIVIATDKILFSTALAAQRRAFA